MDKEYTYSAFISYSSKDSKIAKALWKKLETYRLPAVLQKQYEDIPSKMHVFLDQGDIVPGDTVENALSRELADSKKLIVICSPDSAKSKYVQLEVKNFLALGHSTNDIIPYIIDGVVNRKSSDNCYVPALYGRTEKNTINGVSVIRDGKWKAFVGVLANLLDVKFDEIYKREKVRKNKLITTLCILGLLTATFIGLVFWYVMPHTKCYNDYITKWGIPIGCEKAKKQFGSTYYEITTQYGRPTKLVHKNYWGIITGHDSTDEQQNRPRYAEYTYKHKYLPFMKMKDWKLSTVDCLIDPNTGKNFDEQHMLMVYNWSDDNNAMIKFYYDKEKNIPKTLYNNVLSYQNIYYDDIPNLLQGLYEGESTASMPDIQLMLNSSNIYSHNVVFNEEGYESIISFYNYAGQIVSDKNNIHGFLRFYNEKGKLIREEYQYDHYSSNQLIKYLDYDENNEIKKVSYHIKNFNNENEKLKINKSRNYAYKTIEKQFDENNNYVSAVISYYDENNNLISEKKDGIKTEKVIINSDIKTIIQTELKESGEEQYICQYDFKDDYLYMNVTMLLNNKEDYRAIQKSNSDGKIVFTQFELKDKTIERNTIYQNNEDGGLSKTEIYDESDFIISVYDKFGRHIEDTRTIDGETISVKLVHDGFNKHIYYFNNGQATSKYTGFAQADFSYHSSGILQNVVYRNENGKKVKHFYFDFSEYDAIITPHGLKRHEEFKDENGNIINSRYHDYAIFEGDSGSKDLFLTEGRYLLADGSRANNNKFWFEQIEYPFPDSFDIPVNNSIRYYDSEGKTVKYIIYDNIGKELYICLFDYQKNGDLHIYIDDYLGRLVRFENRSSNGNLKNEKNDDYAVMKTSFLDNGKQITESINDLGKLVYKKILDKDKRHEEHFWYNSNSEIRTTANIFYNEDGSYRREDTNNQNNITTIYYYDKDGKILPYPSNKLCVVSNVPANQELNIDIKVEDIILELGNFSYFNNSKTDFSRNKDSTDNLRAVFYRPSTKQILLYEYEEIPNLSIKIVSPCNTIEESQHYINEIKSSYDKLNKKNN